MLAIVFAVLLVPSLIFAGANKFGAAKAVASGDNMVVIPLEITNEANLTALDIPLKFSEGVTLTEVNFDDTRVSYFDLKIARIDNVENTVVIGLLPQISPEQKPDLQAGSGVIANLVFSIDDKNLEELTLEAVTMTDPNHDLTFVYHDYDRAGTRSIRTVSRAGGAIDFESVTVALKNGESLPESYALRQNYPNPFNPVTQVAFDLPKASHVKLTVYNVLGQEVDVLMDQRMEAGSHVAEWDAESFSTGVYFYRIAADNFTETKKMLLLK
jgi:hypothetical protein